MSAQVIPRSQWVEFVRWFTDHHRHWLVTARWRERLTTLHLLVQNALLEKASVALAAREPLAVPDVDRFRLEFASDLRQIPRHELLSVSAIRYYHDEAGDRLELESTGGAVLSLWLRPVDLAEERQAVS